MRKILIATITVLLIILATMMVINKIEIGNLKIFGTKEIRTQRDSLDTKIKQGNKTLKIYNAALTNIDKAYGELEEAKQTYEEKVKAIVTSKREEAKLLQNYSLEFLWIQIGLHARQEGVKLTITPSRTGASTETDLLTGKEVDIYDIQFEATGSYEAITEFIYSIEEDSKLGFGIEDFKISLGGSENNLISQFKCSDIRIYKDSISSATAQYNFGNNNTNNNNINTNNSNTNDNNTNNTNEKDNTSNNNSNTAE